jgi:hypothetical protein
MNLADQLQADINYQKIIQQVSTDLSRNTQSFISDSLLRNGHIQRLKNDGFNVNSDGQQYNGGVYVSFKQPYYGPYN